MSAAVIALSPAFAHRGNVDDKDRAHHAAAHRRGLVTRAEAGDPDAARAMLQHAMAAMRRAVKASEDAAQSDGAPATAPGEDEIVALSWMADGIERALQGEPLEGAFLLTRPRQPGRPGHSGMRQAVEASLILTKVEAVRASMQRAGGGPVLRRAVIAKAATQIGCSPSKVREALALMARIEATSKTQR